MNQELRNQLEEVQLQNLDPSIWKQNKDFNPAASRAANSTLFMTMVDTKHAVVQLRNILDRLGDQLPYKKVYLWDLNNDQPGGQYGISYDMEGVVQELPYNTRAINRQKESLSMFTIDALNKMDKLPNGRTVEWEKYKNSFSYTYNNTLYTRKTKLVKVFHLS